MFKYLIKTQDQYAKVKHLTMKGWKHYKVKLYVYISIHDQVNDHHNELIRITLDPLTVLWPDLPRIENIGKG